MTYAYHTYTHAVPIARLERYVDVRFLASSFSIYLLWLFVVALIFLASDIGSRDSKERMAEVIYSRPVSNVELLGGRFVGLVIAAWLPLCAAFGLVQVIGTVARMMDWPFGAPLEPASLAGFLILDALPALGVWCGFVLLLAVVAVNRLFVAGASLATVGMVAVGQAYAPAYVASTISLVPTHEVWASDLLPRFGNSATFIQRCALLLLAMSALLFASVVLRRPTDGGFRRRPLVGATVLAGVALGAVCYLVLRGMSELQLRDRWLETHHRAASNTAAVPDVESWRGDVRIVPGERLELALEAKLSARDADLRSLVLSFNPSMRVQALTLDGSPVDFRHEDGLLTIRPRMPIPSGTTAVLTLRAAGVPDPRFAYLDSAVDWRHKPLRSRLQLLGTEASVFDSRYVALMPGIHWLPTAGPNLEAQETDLVNVDLSVTVPAGWLVAGPGRRRVLGVGRFRFQPDAAVPAVGLFASRFERRTTEVAGIEFELLMHPEHLRNVNLFADAGQEITVRLGALFEEAKTYGVPYPYDAYSLVEVPARLRGYGGGWRMATTQALPGVLLLKEHGFPNGHYSIHFPEGDEPDEVARRKAIFLQQLFTWGSGPGNAVRSMAMNLTSQTTSTGVSADVLEFLRDELVTRILIDPDEPGAAFTAHAFDRTERFGSAIARSIVGLTTSNPFIGGFRPDLDRTRIMDRSDRQPVPLEDVARFSDARFASGLLQIRGSAIARSIHDTFGNRRTGIFLSGLGERRSGDGFNQDDFSEIARDSGLALGPLLGDWLADAGTPGFQVSDASLSRLMDDERGAPRYQVLVHVRNDESVPGVVRLGERTYVGRAWLSGVGEFSRPIAVPAKTSLLVGWVLPKPPSQILLTPYMSLNRESIPVRVRSKTNAKKAVEGQQPFSGTEVSNWRKVVEGIVVDDLDPGLAVELANERWLLGMRARSIDPDMHPGDWARSAIPGSWGKYRQTALISSPGAGDEKVVFAASLPAQGKWKLDLHVPARLSPKLATSPGFYGVDDEAEGRVFFGALGTYDIAVVSAGERVAVKFAGARADAGWNDVGTFDIAADTVRVEITNRTDGDAVVADAVRWIRADQTERGIGVASDASEDVVPKGGDVHERRW